MLVDLSIAINQVAVSVAIMPLEVSAVLMQVAVSAANVGILEKDGVDLEMWGMTPFTNYAGIICLV